MGPRPGAVRVASQAEGTQKDLGGRRGGRGGEVVGRESGGLSKDSDFLL